MLERHMRLNWLSLIALSCLSALSAQADTISYQEAIERVSSLSPRPENSANEAALFRYIEEKAVSLGIAVHSTGFSKSKDYHSYSKILTCRIEGALQDTLVVAVSANTAPGQSGSESDSVPMAIALSVMERVSRLPKAERGISVDFVFLGAEFGLPGYGPSTLYPLGSRRLISDFPESRPTCVVYLGPRSLSSTILVNIGAKGLVSPHWLFTSVTKALGDSGFTVKDRSILNIFFRASLLDGSGPASAFLSAGIPALELTTEGGDASLGGPAALAGWGDFLVSFMKQNQGGLSENWDRHYFIFDFPQGLFVFKEGPFVVLILASLLLVCLVFLFSTLFARKTVIGLVKGFSRSLHALPVYYSLCLLVLFGTSLFLAFVFSAKGGGEYWTAAPAVYFWARVALMGGLFCLAVLLLVRARILPITISFYGFGSALLFFLDIFIFSALDLSFSLFFAWSSIACILSMLFRNKPVSVFAAVCTFAPFAFLVASGGFTAESRLFAVLLLPGLRQSLILAFLVLPIVLMCMRLLLIFYRPERTPGKAFTSWTGAVTACLAISGVVFIFIFDPYASGRAVPISMDDVIDRVHGSRVASVEAPSWIKAGEVELGGQGFSLNGKPPFTLMPEMSDGKGIRLSSQRESFLARKLLRLNIEAKERPYGILCELSSGQEIRIFDCSLPYTVEDDGRLVRIHVGVEPSMPLRIELTVPQDFRARLRCELDYPLWGLTTNDRVRFSSGMTREIQSMVLE
jgi:hypothetical protein